MCSLHYLIYGAAQKAFSRRLQYRSDSSHPKKKEKKCINQSFKIENEI